jgi:hypothetical protein
MSKDDEIQRNFNGRIFIKGKCYNFDTIQPYGEPINDVEITSTLAKFFIGVKKLINYFTPGMIVTSKYNKKVMITWMLVVLSLMLFSMVIWFFFFNTSIRF